MRRLWRMLYAMGASSAQGWIHSRKSRRLPIIPSGPTIFIVMLAIAMKMGLVLYNEMKADSSYEYATDMWLVDDFYNYQVLKEVVNEF